MTGSRTHFTRLLGRRARARLQTLAGPCGDGSCPNRPGALRGDRSQQQPRPWRRRSHPSTPASFFGELVALGSEDFVASSDLKSSSASGLAGSLDSGLYAGAHLPPRHRHHPRQRPLPRSSGCRCTCGLDSLGLAQLRDAGLLLAFDPRLSTFTSPPLGVPARSSRSGSRLRLFLLVVRAIVTHFPLTGCS